MVENHCKTTWKQIFNKDFNHKVSKTCLNNNPHFLIMTTRTFIIKYSDLITQVKLFVISTITSL